MSILPYALRSGVRGLRFRLTRKLPTRSVEEVWPGIRSVQITVKPFTGQFGNVKPNELATLCGLAKHFNARRLVEIGTFNGSTTWHLAANTPADARIWTIDLPRGDPARLTSGLTLNKIEGVAIGNQFAETPEAAKIEQVFQDSTTYRPDALLGQVDFCFVDGGHLYETVLKDTENALALVKPGGIILWHDYSRWWPGVQRCLDELGQRLPIFRVVDTSLGALQVPC